MSSKSPEEQSGRKAESFAPIRDLSDFSLRWPELRTLIRPEDVYRETHQQEAREVLRWLCLLADRVCLAYEE